MILAPMADVTDCVFRQIIAKYGKPDVFWTEFVSADGLAYVLKASSENRLLFNASLTRSGNFPTPHKLLIDLKYGENEHPIVAQIFGGKPENIKIASAFCAELGFDGIDINMGCPDKSVEKQCAGAAMIRDPKLAREIIRAAKEGAPNLPISVKTRIGYNKNEIETWIRELLSEDLAVLTVHLRTRKEMSLVPAHWDLMARIVEIRNEMKKDTLIIGNGDVMDLADARKKAKETGCDGVMLGKAIFGNPWLFSAKEHISKSTNNRRQTIQEKLQVMVEHTKLFEEMLGGYKNFAIMKKHYKAYVNGFDGAKELRMKLMEAKNASEIEKITTDFLLTLPA